MSAPAIGALGVLAVFLGFGVVLACLVPYVAWSYRRHGTVRPGHAVLLVAAALYAVGLWTYTILPLPADPQQWCTAHTVVPQLRPLQLVADVRGAGSGAVLRNRAVLQVLLNVVLFVPLGALLRALTGWSVPRLLVAGLTASLLVELTQLTGDWGVYPCAYRLFDVDDLLVNTAGTGLGAGVVPVLSLLQRRVAAHAPVRAPAEATAGVTTGRRLLGMTLDVVSVGVLGAVAWLVFVLLHSTGPGQVDVPPGWQRALVVEVLPAVAVLLVVPLLQGGPTVGQLATRVRPVRVDGAGPTRAQMAVRFATGSGGYFLLRGLDGVLGAGTLGDVAHLLGLASVLAAWRSRGHRGLSGLAARLTVVDVRSGPGEAARTLDQGPGWELRRMSTAVVSLAVAAYLVVALVGVAAQASSAAGTVAVLVLVVAFAVLTVGLAGYLVANGVTMVRRERRSLGNLLSLIVGLGSVVLLVTALLAVTRGSGWVIVGAVSALALSGYVGFLLTAFIGYGLLYGRLLPRPGADAVVTLGSRLFGSRVPPLLASRLDRAVTVYERERDRGNQPLMICSGGRGSLEPVAEATAMADYLRGHGVPDEVVVEEDRSRNTEQNLRFSWELTRARGGNRLVAVTNDFHAFRAALIAREIGVPAQVVGSPTARYYFPSAVLREFVGVLARRRLLYAVTGALVAASAGSLARLVLG